MSEKYSARELAFHYLARKPEKMSEERFLSELIKSEMKFSELLAGNNPPEPGEPVPYKKWN
ncbi:hypothetical protein [Enterobacter cloacae]|uniref:hypothetical protein n=1 Tax=Enterobacter cloacae TaxID=550 RepID=UPI00294EFF4A|nr:hypothetical protein [Enterobacter sichuanensis]